MIFGIYKLQTATETPNTNSRFFREIDSGYAYEAINADKQSSIGKLKDPSKVGYAALRPYGKNCQNGDVIEMTLDLNQHTLAFNQDSVAQLIEAWVCSYSSTHVFKSLSCHWWVN